MIKVTEYKLVNTDNRRQIVLGKFASRDDAIIAAFWALDWSLVKVETQEDIAINQAECDEAEDRAKRF